MPLFSEIDELFSYAESKIKKIEHLGSGLTTPAVNQLRYVTCHLLRYDRSNNEKEKQEELRKAKNHCERAIYDAVEIGIVFCLRKLENFQEDYATTVVADIVPNYVEIRKTANEANEFISKITKDSTEDHCNNRGDRYKKCAEYFDKLDDYINTLDCARPELNKKMDRERLYVHISIATLILTLIGIYIASNC